MIAGRYRLVRELGRGGSGVVHLGHDELLGREVALKQLGLAPGAGAPDAERAEREAKLSASVSHPSIVAVYDLVEHDSCDWLVMEYVPGTTLAELIRTEGLDAGRTAALIAQVAQGLAVAHRGGVVHRDVKPSNVLVTTDGRAKLGDFGIARGSSDAALTRTGLVTGSPAYLAPEVISGASATEASDVWSLGATLFHALAGRAPYEIGDNLVGGLLAVVQGEPPRLPDAPAPLRQVLEATMTKDPAGRWSADQVAAALRGEPVTPAARPAERTSVLAAGGVRAAARPATTPVPPAAAPPSAPPAAGSGPAPSHGGARRAWWAGAAVAVLLAAALAWQLWPQPDPTPTGQGQAQTETGSQEPVTEETTDPSLTPEQTEADMRAFIANYLTTVTTDPRAAFALLTPEYQAASGDLKGYLGWWNQVSSAELLNLKADPETLDVSYSVKYEMRNGKKRTERIDLHLVRHDDHYLIDGAG